jgi:drug/metabolite transporter (DMT)-like permease
MSKRSQVHVALLVVQVMFGTLPLAGQIALEGMAPVALATLRIAGAALVLGLVAGRRLAGVRPADLARLAGLAVLGVVGNQVLFLMGLARSTQINASVLVTTIPVFTVAFAVVLRRERASAVRLAGVAVGLAGALLLARVERFDLSDGVVTGNVMILVNAAFWSLHLVLARPLLARLGPLVTSTWMFVMGALAMVPVGAAAVVEAIRSAPPASWAGAAWAVVVSTILSYLVNMWALRRIEASSVAAYVYLQPVVAGVLAWLVAGETLDVRTGVAAAAVFAGVAMVQWGGAPSRRDS